MKKYLDDVQTIPCPLCQKNNVTILGTSSRGGLNINSVICNTCALIYLNPKPSANKYYEFYASGDYRRFLNSVKGKDSRNNIDNYFTDERFNKKKEDGKQIAKKYFKQIIDENELYFDFGCDIGGIMAGVQEECGCRVMGNEPSQLCAAYIKNKLGISILNCSMEDISDIEKKRFKGQIKLASIKGLLEHANDPVKCLKVAYDMLVDKGYLYVETFDILKRMEIQIEAVENVATFDHQYYFHKNVLIFMLQKCGFEVIRFDYDSYGGKMMQVLARKTGPKSSQCIFDPKEVIQKVLELNERAQRYRTSFSFLLKEAKRKMIQKARKFAKVAIKQLV